MKAVWLATGCAVAGVVLATAIVVTPGCGGDDFLGLEDYQRDLLIGGLAAALLNQQATANGQGEGEAPAPIDGRDGVDGLNCWDLNGNGEGDPAEDINEDGVFDALDCQGSVGPAGQDGADGQDGAPGAAGVDGQSGADGLHCWDLNGNGAGDPEEDANGDGYFNTLDCQGAAGPAGPAGPSGSNGSAGRAGADGPEFFDIFIDDFFTVQGAPRGDLAVVIVSIQEPELGVRNQFTGVDGVVGYRVAIPDTYAAGSDVTMRLFFNRNGTFDGDCFVFTVDGRRLRAGSGIEAYGETRWVRVDAFDDGGGDVFLVVDLPLNAVSGLHYPNDLSGGDFLAFELNTYMMDGQHYHLLGVEFFESANGTAALYGATVFSLEDDVTCGYDDCNENGIPDEADIAEGISEDCNENGIPDECDIAEGTSEDCQPNGTPDECELCTITAKAVFIAEPRISLGTVQVPITVLWWDSTPTWGSQAPDALRQEMSDYLTNFNGGGVFNSTYVSSETPGTFAEHMSDNSYDVIVFDATSGAEKFDADDLNAVRAHYADHSAVLLDGILYIRSINYDATTNFPGINGSTGGFTVNEVYQLAEHGGGIMIGTDHNCCQVDANQVLGAVIPGAAFSGYTVPSVDGQFNGDDLLNAIAVVSPFDIFTHWSSVPSEAIAPTGTFTDTLGNQVTLYSQVDVADQPGGGQKFPYISTSWEAAGVGPEFDCNDNGILDSIDIQNGTSQDINQNGIPDECEELDCSPDCNANGVPDECDIADQTSQDCNENGIPDECDIADGRSQDCQPDGIPDECQLVDNDCNENGVPDDCDGGCVECITDADCDDGDLCTTDICVTGDCLYVPVECPDGMVCVEGECVEID